MTTLSSGRPRRLVLCEESGRIIGEAGTDLLAAEWENGGKSVTGVIKLRGDSPLVDWLMKCASMRLVMVVETAAEIVVFRVKRHSYKYERGSWFGYAEVSQDIRSDPSRCRAA